MASKIKVAFLGVRHPHMWHRIALLEQMSDQVDVIGFYDEDSYYVEGFTKKTGMKNWPDLGELLHQKPDLCIVESWDVQTPEIARKAAPWTRAMILEKCTAPTYLELKELADDLSKYPIHIEHGFELHYLPIMEKCREIINSGVLGQITLARFHGGSPSGCSDEVWVNNPRLMGGMFYIEGSHMIEIMLDTLGEPDCVQGVASKLHPGEKVYSTLKTSDLFAGAGNPPTYVRIGEMVSEDVAVAIASYSDKIATVDCTAWEATGWCNGWRMEYYGTNGTLIACPIPSWADLFVRYDKGGYVSGQHRIELPVMTQNNELQMRGAYRNQLEKMIRMLNNDDAPCQDGMKMILSVARVAAQVYGAPIN